MDPLSQSMRGIWPDFAGLEFENALQTASKGTRGLPRGYKSLFYKDLFGGEGGIRTHVPVTRQDAFEAPPLRPLRYLSVYHSARRASPPRCALAAPLRGAARRRSLAGVLTHSL